MSGGIMKNALKKKKKNYGRKEWCTTDLSSIFCHFIQTQIVDDIPVDKKG